MTNDKDGAALLREAIEPFMREIDRLEAEYGFDRPLHQGQCIMLPLSALLNLRAALKSHGQAFDAALLDRAELAWQRFFYPALDNFDGPTGDKLPSVDLEVADCLRLVLAAMGRHVVTPQFGVPSIQTVARDAQLKTVAEKLAAFTGAPYEDWRHFTVEAGDILDRLDNLPTNAAPQPAFDAAGVREACLHIVARCEALEDESYNALATDLDNHEAGFHRGQKSTAKALRREFHDLTRALPIPEAPASVEPVACGTYRHVKRGTAYDVIGHAELQAATFNVHEGDKLVIYQGGDGKMWARLFDEFHDGRFELVTAEPDTIGSNFGNGGGFDPVADHSGDATYLICKGGAYYRPNAQGYTRNRSEAGRYTLEEAISYSHPNGPDGPRDGITYELDTATPSPGFGGGDLREAIHKALSSELGDTYDCGRVWDAWHVGTMGEDDFTPVNDRVDEITETIIAAISHDQRGGSGE